MFNVWRPFWPMVCLWYCCVIGNIALYWTALYRCCVSLQTLFVAAWWSWCLASDKISGHPIISSPCLPTLYNTNATGIYRYTALSLSRGILSPKNSEKTPHSSPFRLRPSSSMNGIFCPSVCPSVTPFWLCSHYRIIMKFSGVITKDQGKVHAKGQGQRSEVKVTEVTTQLNRFRTVTPVWIHIWWWNDTYSLMLLRRGALLFLKVIRQISRSHGAKNRRIWPRLGVSGL